MSKVVEKKASLKENSSSSNGGESSEQLSNTSLVQMKQEQHSTMFDGAKGVIQNKTGMPDSLKSGVEALSGQSMDDVKVHYNSDKPSQLGAHAYAQGSDIHVASGQEKHLPHEAWHVAQQKQGRVQPTTTANGAAINDDASLEKEADVMGAKALQAKAKDGVVLGKASITSSSTQLMDADSPSDDAKAAGISSTKVKKFSKALNKELNNVKSSRGDADAILNSTIAMLDTVFIFSKFADPSLKNKVKKYKSTVSRVNVANGKFKSIMKRMDSDFIGALDNIPNAKEFSDAYKKLSAQIFKEAKKA